MAAYNVLKKKEKKIKSGEHVFLPPLPHPPVARALYSQMYEYVIEKITWDKKKKNTLPNQNHYYVSLLILTGT